MISVGSKVVCIKGLKELRPLNHQCTCPNGAVLLGDIYVVKGFYVSPSGKLGLILIGKPSIDCFTGQDFGWWSERFRELEHEQMRSALEYHRSLPQPEQPAFTP